MTKQFLKKDEIQLINGGYLSNKDGKPVFNNDFVIAQKNAEWVMAFAAKSKGKDFVGKEAYSIKSLKDEVSSELNKNNLTEYIKTPKAPVREVSNKLKKEALAFVTHGEEELKTEKINKFLNQFDIINEFETHGLFFTEDIVKLNKIYTIDEIVKATKSVIDLLD